LYKRITLYDLNDHKEYASFFENYEEIEIAPGEIAPIAPDRCQVRQKVCHSEDEFQELLKVYMEE
jgi:hypothetical protein